MKKIIIPIVVLSLSGCAVQKNWQPLSGSKADGIVRLSYTHFDFELPQVSSHQGQTLAESRCQSWGYTGATSFGFEYIDCNRYYNGSCFEFIITKEYQCTK